MSGVPMLAQPTWETEQTCSPNWGEDLRGAPFIVITDVHFKRGNLGACYKEKGKRMESLGTAMDQALLTERAPTQEEIDSAARAVRAIAVAMERDGWLRVAVENDETVEIAQAVGHVIIELLAHINSGNKVVLASARHMPTTQQGSDVLNVISHEQTKLLKPDWIHFEEMTESQRQISLYFKAVAENKRRRGLEALEKRERRSKQCPSSS